MLYVPKAAFEAAGISNVPTLGLISPSISVDVLLKRSSDIFGFKFVLIGQETLDRIREYRPQNIELQGFSRLFHIVGLALDPVTIRMIKTVDGLLKDTLPDPSKIKNLDDLWGYYTTYRPEQLAILATDLIKNLHDSEQGLKK